MLCAADRAGRRLNFHPAIGGERCWRLQAKTLVCLADHFPGRSLAGVQSSSSRAAIMAGVVLQAPGRHFVALLVNLAGWADATSAKRMFFLTSGPLQCVEPGQYLSFLQIRPLTSGRLLVHQLEAHEISRRAVSTHARCDDRYRLRRFGFRGLFR
jgi:hypothetical protein